MSKLQVSVQHGILETRNLITGNLDWIPVGSDEWFSWLEKNSAFRFEHDGQSFSARKENPLKKSASDNAGGDGLPEYDDSKAYWQAYRKVDGKTRKRYIGKSATLTHNRLIEISKALDEPAAPKPAKELPIKLGDSEVTQLESRTFRLQTNYDNALERIKALEKQVDELHKQIRDYEAKPEPQESELHNPVCDSELESPARELPDRWTFKSRLITKLPLFKEAKKGKKLVYEEITDKDAQTILDVLEELL